nr:MAG TPA: hypothetical protein [Caudoviricetes sp.]
MVTIGGALISLSMLQRYSFILNYKTISQKTLVF